MFMIGNNQNLIIFLLFNIDIPARVANFWQMWENQENWTIMKNSQFNEYHVF